MKINDIIAESVNKTPKPPFKGPYTKAGENRKDQFGNEIKFHNLPGHLAKLARNKLSKISEDRQGVAEAKGLAKKVKIVKGPYAGKIGWIREIIHGAFKGAPKTYNIDLDDGGQANNIPGTALRLVKQAVAEDVGDSPVINAISRRIRLQRTDLLAKYGLEKVTDAIVNVADFVGNVEEIGSSDVSSWVKHVEQMLGNMSEGGMPSSIVRVKEKIRFMTDAEKKEYFKGKTEEQLRQMAWRHGYGRNSNMYSKYATDGVAEDASGSDVSDSDLHPHGSPYDRGDADFYYGRQLRPHKGGVGGGSGPRTEELSPEEIKDYTDGYEQAKKLGHRKQNEAATGGRLKEVALPKATPGIENTLKPIVDKEDYDRLYNLFDEDGIVGKYLQTLIQTIVADTGLHPDDDLEEIEGIIMDRLQQEFGEHQAYSVKSNQPELPLHRTPRRLQTRTDMYDTPPWQKGEVRPPKHG